MSRHHHVIVGVLFLEHVAGERQRPGTERGRARHRSLPPKHDCKAARQACKLQGDRWQTRTQGLHYQGHCRQFGQTRCPRGLTPRTARVLLCAGHRSQTGNRERTPQLTLLQSCLAGSAPRLWGEGTLVGTRGSSKPPAEPGAARGRGQKSRAPSGSHGGWQDRHRWVRERGYGQAQHCRRAEARTPGWPRERGGGPLQSTST